MAAFEACRSEGIPGIELDIHICDDGKLVVIHDNDLERVAGLKLEVEKCCWNELRNIDVGSSKDPGFSGERIPLLADVLDCYGDDLYFDIEIKNGVSTDKGIAQALSSLLKDIRPKAPLIVSSFNPLEMQRFKSIMPEVPTAIIYSRDPEVPWYLRRGLGRLIGNCDGLKPEYQQAGLRARTSHRWVLPWTVNNRIDGERLLKVGAAGLVSDDPRPFLSTEL
ncbi:glycerophosphodiester phosphodiesterase family protein [Spirochaeta dissipatitropha]